MVNFRFVTKIEMIDPERVIYAKHRDCRRMKSLDDYPRFQIVSDLHIESLYASGRTVRDVVVPSARYLIIAGDLGRVENEVLYRRALKELCKMFEKVILVAGNHEYYSMNLSGSKITFDEVNKFLWGLNKTPGMENLIFLHDDYIFIDGILIYGSTFWSYCPYQHYKPLPIYFKSSDRIKSADFNNMHLRAARELENVIQYAGAKRFNLLVVTHYAPSFHGTLSPKHVGNFKNYMYCSSSEHFVENSCIIAWVYGHTGHNGNVGKLVTNQLDNVSNGLPNAVLTLKPR